MFTCSSTKCFIGSGREIFMVCLAGNFAPDAVKAADLREGSIATDPFGVAPDKARLVGLVCFGRGVRMAFEAGLAVAFQVGDGAGNGAFEADLGQVDAVGWPRLIRRGGRAPGA